MLSIRKFKERNEVKMFEALSLTVFAGVCYLFLIGVPSVVEKISSEEFKHSYLNFLGKADLHSYGKSYF